MFIVNHHGSLRNQPSLRNQAEKYSSTAFANIINLRLNELMMMLPPNQRKLPSC